MEDYAGEYAKEYNIKFRKYQQKVINSIVDAFLNKDYKNVVVEAPTGFGKSLVNYMVALILFEHEGFDAWYTTPQVSLLDQLEKDKLIDALGGIAIIKGKDKYICPFHRGINKEPVPVNLAPCNTQKGFVCRKYDQCPYNIAKAKAMDSWIAGMSFAFMILTKDIDRYWGTRDLLIVDEADDLESWAVDFGTLKFTTPQTFPNIYSVMRWAEVQLSNIRRKIRFYEEIPTKNAQIAAMLESLKRKEMKLEFFLDDAEEHPDNWTFTKKGATLELKPIDAGIILNSTIWWRGQYRLITSATIGPLQEFKRYTGLRGKTLFIRVPHPIPAVNRPIIIKAVGKMTKEERQNTYDRLIETIVAIANQHSDEKGIIHAHSYEIANEIKRRLSLDRKIITHGKDDRTDKLSEFMSSDEPAIFVCVGFERGLDLKYDLARWQIITKVPYPDISDPRVREIWVKRKNWRWARYQAIKTLIQACGRIVRAEDDYGVTYILDSSINHLLKYKKEFPSWFLEAISHDVGTINSTLKVI